MAVIESLLTLNLVSDMTTTRAGCQSGMYRTKVWANTVTGFFGGMGGLRG